MIHLFELLKSKFQTSDIAKRMASRSIWSFTGTALAKYILVEGSEKEPFKEVCPKLNTYFIK